MNAYGLLNEELKRMHEEKDRLFTMALDMEYSSSGNERMDARGWGGSPGMMDRSYDRQSSISNYHIKEIRDRLQQVESQISKLRTIMAKIVMDADKEIQEKVAEMALTGITKE